MQAKTPKESHVQMTEIVLPQDTNMLGNIFGGTIMKWMDISAALSARRHCRKVAVTVSMDRVDFIFPIKLGNTVVINSRVHWVGKTSMEVGVTIESEEIHTGKRNLSAKGNLTFVAIDDDGKPTPVPSLKLETEEEKRLFEEADKRKKKASRG